MYELDFPNPELDDLELIEAKPRKRRRKKNPEPAIAVATPVLLLGLAYAGWILFNKSKFGVWDFTPWKLAGLTKPRLQLRRNTNEAQEERRRASLHEAIEEMMKPSVYTVEEIDTWKKPTYRPVTEETVSFIYP